MENKKTTELIDLLPSLVDEDGNLLEGHEEALEELKSRSPFWEIFEADFEESLPALWDAIEELREEVKLLKRHKHDEKTGDVMVRV